MISTLDDGQVKFRVYLPHAAKVELLADFTDGRDHRVAMNRTNPGWWEVTLPVGSGEHTFCYLVDGSIWLADYAAHGVKLNGYGGWISRLCVNHAATVTTRGTLAAA
ncbi:MAG: hypothetical protein ACT4PL_06495 [Phycisphaerales bacterium]